MKSIRGIGIISFLAAMIASAAPQTTAPDSIKAYYRRYDALVLKNDVAGLDALFGKTFAKNFLDISEKDKYGKVSTMNRAQEIREFQRSAQQVDVVTKSVTHIDGVKVGPSTALITVTVTFGANLKKTPDGLNHKFTHIERGEHTWVKNGADWKLRSQKRVYEKNFIDGAPLRSED